MFDTTVIQTRLENRVLRATLNSPPLNLIGPEIGSDLVTIIQWLETHEEEVRVVVFDSALPDYFSAHFDMRQTARFNEEIGRLLGSASIATLYDRLSSLKQVTIAAIAGRIGGAGNELALACDMRFASRERAAFTQMEVGVGIIPGGGAVQRMPRLMGRGRALEVMLGADTYSAELAERYGWVNRALPDVELMPFVEQLAQRIAGFPMSGVYDTKARVDGLTSVSVTEVAEDLRLFKAAATSPNVQARLSELFARGMQTDGEVERSFGDAVGSLPPDADTSA